MQDFDLSNFYSSNRLWLEVQKFSSKLRLSKNRPIKLIIWSVKSKINGSCSLFFGIKLKVVKTWNKKSSMYEFIFKIIHQNFRLVVCNVFSRRARGGKI